MSRRLSSSQSADLVPVLEAIYDVEKPRDEWLGGVLRAARQAFDAGGGVAAVLYDIASDELRIDAEEGIGVSPAWMQIGADVHRSPNFTPHIVQFYRSILVASMDDLDPDNLRHDVHRDRHGPSPIWEDNVMINGANASGIGCALHVLLDRPARLTDAARLTLTRVATHLAAGYRLQRRLARPDATAGNAMAAVFDGTGRLEHAEAAARSAAARADLREAVRRRERALGQLRREPDRAVATVRGLVNARWSLVDHFESDGKRYIVARENVDDVNGPRALSAREQHVVALAALGRSNKLIAYELGLAQSTIRVLMARAAAKLHARTREELLSIFRSSRAAKRRPDR